MEGYLYVQEKSTVYFCIRIVPILYIQAGLISTGNKKMQSIYGLLNRGI